MKLSEAMRAHWADIEFSPETFELEFDENEAEEEAKAKVLIKNKAAFSPTIERPSRTAQDMENYTGVNIKNLPKDIEQPSLLEFLFEAGLSETTKNSNIMLGDHGNVDISELDKDDCITLTMNIHKKVFFGRMLYCRPIIG